MMADNLLVTTSLEDTWGDSERIIFLGEWCKTYDKRHVWSKRDYETIPFHWDDRDKLKKDYNYLEALHHSLLVSLAMSLNELHQVDYSVRYWQILLDPWLMAYVGTIFDRWECLRVAFNIYGELKLLAPEGFSEIEPPFSYSEFIEQATSDVWNHVLYLRIIENQYSDQCVIARYSGTSSLENREELGKFEINSRQSLKSKVLFAAEKIIGKLFTSYDTVFVGSSFNIIPLIRLNLSLGQIPRLFLNEFNLTKISDDFLESTDKLYVRDRVSVNFQPKSDFEKFISESVPYDLPSCVVEGYHTLRKQVARLPIKNKAIVTANFHWTNVVAKAWFAEQVAKGTKLVILEHGGSLPAYKELFDFEEDISDVRGTWFLPYHPKHRRVSPSRLIGRFNKSRLYSRGLSNGKYCSIIGNESPRWVYRVHFYPMASQCLVSVDLVKQFYNNLTEDIKDYIRVKPAPDNGWNTQKIYADMLGAHKVYQEASIDRVFRQSMLIICTYPETTFSEAMASGIPTVMIYPDYYYERHPATFQLLELLRSSKIIFHDPSAAAAHINYIWPDPDQWWGSPEVVEARKEFHRQACDLDSDWLKEWTAFLKGVNTWDQLSIPVSSTTS